MRRSYLLILLALILISSPLLFSAWQRNSADLGLLALCLEPGAPYAQPLTHDAWWQAIASGCRGDLAGEQRAFAAALAQGIQRIDVMRVVLPQATSLARLAVQRFPGSPNAQFWLGESLAAAGDTSGDTAGAVAWMRAQPKHNGKVGLFGGDPMTLVNPSGTLTGKIPAGSHTYIHNAALIWLVFLVPLAFAGWYGMHNIATDEVTPKPGHPLGAMGKITGMLAIGFVTAAIGLYIILPHPAGLGAPSWAKWFVLAGVIALTVFLMKQIPGDIKPNLQRQFKIFGNKHTWILSVIYTMTFGSFIGYSAAFALAIKVIFGFQHVIGAGGVITSTPNPNGPSALM